MSLHFPVLTASSVDRFLSCPGSITLPFVAGESNIYGQKGTDEHALRLRPGQLPQKVYDWFGCEPEYEAAYTADLESDAARFLGHNISRGYLAPTAMWIAGSIDMVSVQRVCDENCIKRTSACYCSETDSRNCPAHQNECFCPCVLSVADLKTGQQQARGALPSPAQSGQLKCGAWLVVRYMRTLHPNWTPTRIRLAWWTTADRPDDIEDDEIPFAQLEEWANKLTNKIKSTLDRTKPPMFRRSSYCEQCHAFDACAFQGGAIRRVAELSGRLASGGQILDKDVGAAWQDLRAAERAVETAKKALLAKVSSQPETTFSVGDGRVLKLVRSSRTEIDPALALQVLQEHMGDDAANCFETSISQASIMRGLGTKNINHILAELEAVGGLSKVPTAEYLREVRRGKNDE